MFFMNTSNNASCKGPAQLPDFARSTWFLTLIWPLAQAVLLAVHLYSFGLIRGELNEGQLAVCRWIGLGVALHAGLGLVVTLVPRLRRALLHPVGLAGWILFLAGTLWAFCWAGTKALPHHLPVWIFNGLAVYGVQFMLTMPALFVGLLLLATQPLPLGKGPDVVWSAVALLAPPGVVYLVIQVAGLIYRQEWGWARWFHLVVLLVVVAASVLMFLGLFRILMWICLWLRGRGAWADRGLVVLVALVLPLAGLLLNREIPFPFDFQTVGVYVLTGVNAAALLLPRGPSRAGRWAAWLLPCLTFPFTLYFFLVFVPVFPLAIPAILAAGAGFLVLTPAALFFVHAVRLREVFVMLRGDGVRVGLLAWTGVAAFLVLPGGYVAQCLGDRVALDRAMAEVFHPDSTRDAQPFDRGRAVRAVERLRDRKAGIWLPVLTPVYSRVVFEGLVLPDAKMQRLYRVLTGRELSLHPQQDDPAHGKNFWNRTWRSSQRMPVGPRLARAVVWEGLETASTGGLEDGVRTTWRLKLHNPGKEQDEFVVRLRLEPGVFVSKLRLKIGEEWVDGALFEKKTAVWVYEMIRAERRDPALVTMIGPEEAELRVFPLEAGETREVELEFLHPPGIEPVVSAVPDPGHRFRGVMLSGVPRALRVTDGAHEVRWTPTCPAEAVVTRQPRLVLLVDRSAAGRLADGAMGKAIEHLGEMVPEASMDVVLFHTVTRAGLSAWKEKGKPANSRSRALEELPIAETGRNLPAAVARALEVYGAQVKRREEFPALILLSRVEPGQDELEPVMEWLGTQVPDWPLFGIYSPLEGVRWVDGSGRVTEAELARPRPVALAWDKERVRARPATTGPQWWTGVGDGLVVKGWEERAEVKLPPEHRWGRAALLRAEREEAVRNPAQAERAWAGLVAGSKALGVLIPETAWIVVERAAQWETLRRREAQKLGAEKELDFMETPEPSWVWLAGAMLVAWGMVRWWRRRVGVGSGKINH